MRTRAYVIIGYIAIAMWGRCAYADNLDARASAFAKLYMDVCLKNLPDLEGLRSRLSVNIPKFPPAQAALFLRGNEGDAWPVPSKEHNGNFVVTLWARKNFCSLHGRRASSKDVEALFRQLVEKAPQPFISELREDTWKEATPAGRGHLLSYVWAMPNGTRKFLFMLSTADSENADVQAVASASVMSE